MFNNKYIEKVTSKIDNNKLLTAWKPKGHPVILFNKNTGTPLASLHFEAQNNETQNDMHGNRGDALITSRRDKDIEEPDIQHFQGIINKDDQEFQLVITNLLDVGYINFNILKEYDGVNCVNPGGLNQVNELRPYESYAIKCDQADNKSLILSAIKESTGKTMTIKEDETNAKNTNKSVQGTNFFLSVIPQDNTVYTELFENTMWSTVDYFITKSVNVTNRDNLDQDNSFFNQVGGVFNMQFASAAQNNESSQYFYDEEEEEEEENEEEGYYFGARTMESESSSGGSNDNNNDLLINQLTKSDATITIPSIKESFDMSTVNSSLASTIKKGRDVVVNSGETGIKYKFENNSSPCKIGLSVYIDLDIDANVDIDVDETEASKMIDLIINNKVYDFLESAQIFMTDECVISMNGKPNVIFYTCGHCCVTAEAIKDHTLKTCPMCRKHISAMIMLKGNTKESGIEKILN